MPKDSLHVLAGDPAIIAPCGINCSLCRAYARDRQPCPGCRGGNRNKSNSCLNCTIKNCPEFISGGHRFCFTCANYPCSDLLRLDKRYSTRYSVSVIENLERIRAVGERAFLVEQDAKWSCDECGARLCMHKSTCSDCNAARQHG
jgi:hypothetical protein